MPALTHEPDNDDSKQPLPELSQEQKNQSREDQAAEAPPTSIATALQAPMDNGGETEPVSDREPLTSNNADGEPPLAKENGNNETAATLDESYACPSTEGDHAVPVDQKLSFNAKPTSADPKSNSATAMQQGRTHSGTRRSTGRQTD